MWLRDADEMKILNLSLLVPGTFYSYPAVFLALSLFRFLGFRYFCLPFHLLFRSFGFFCL